MICGIELCCAKRFAQWIAIATVAQPLLDRLCQRVLSTACVATAVVVQPLLIFFFWIFTLAFIKGN